MEESEKMTFPGTATMLETGTPQAIALRKENVIESELKAIEINYRGLKIAGVDDVQGEKAVSDARKYCKKLRVTTERICKDGREDAIKEQRNWLKVEKYVVDRITLVEKELSDEESRIKKLREEIKLEAERKKKAEEDRLQGICNEFAKAGKLMAKDEIRNMEAGAVQMMLQNVQIAKAQKEAAAQKLADDNAAAEAQIKALQKQIADLEAKLHSKQAPAAPSAPAAPPAPAPAPAAAPLQTTRPESRPAMHGTAATLPMPQANGGGAWRTMPRGGSLPMPTAKSNGAAAMPNMPTMPMTAQNGGASRQFASNTQAAPSPQSSGQQAQPLFSDGGALLPPGSGKSEAERIAADKAALQAFALQVDTLKKYVPELQSVRAAGLHELFLEQIEKFVLYISKKQGEI